MPRLITYATAAVLLAAPAFAATPEAWEAYETQVRIDCELALGHQGLTRSNEGAVAHGSDTVGSFLILSAIAEDGTETNWLCRAPRGEGALEVELIELPAGYEIGFADEV
jgi:hypothetical protein